MTTDLFGNKIEISYSKYIKSKAWRNRAKRAKKNANNTCHACKAVGVPLDVHHLTYVRLGNEAPEDLVVLCKPCHKRADQARVVSVSKNRRQRAHRRGLATYVAKVHGPGLENHLDVFEFEFERWLESKGDW